MPRRQRRERGRPWLRTLVNDTERWYLPKGSTGGKLVPITRADGSFIDGQENEAEALKVWHEAEALNRAPDQGPENEVGVILDLYLQRLAKRMQDGKVTQRLFDHARKWLDDFDRRWPNLRIRQLKPFHVEQWWDRHPNWCDGTRRQTGTILLMALNWAAGAKGNNLIPANPLRGMELPEARSRGADALVSDEDHAALLGTVPGYMADVLIVLRNTGTRPSNVFRVTAQDFHPEQGIWRLPKHKTRKTSGRPLTVGLTPIVVEICRRLARKYPEGPLFRNFHGKPWTSESFSNRVRYYCKQLGLRVIAYGYRHTVATNLLKRGEDDAKVAAVLGQAGTAMLHRHYNHLTSGSRAIRDTLTAHITPTSEELEAARRDADN